MKNIYKALANFQQEVPVFLKDTSDLKARKVMFASFVYLPLTLVSLILDKFI
jgi:hypothetical protein